MTVALLDPVRATFRAVATTVVPEADALETDGWSALEQMVEGALADRPERMRGQFVNFLRLIEYLSVAGSFRRFSRLDAAQRTAFLERLARSPLLLIRRGMWGLRTLIMMGYYTQPAVQARLSYRAHPDGWSARRRSGEHAAVPDESGSRAADAPLPDGA